MFFPVIRCTLCIKAGAVPEGRPVQPGGWRCENPNCVAPKLDPDIPF